MADITKCFGQDCPMKGKCYRFTCKSESIDQSYFIEIPGKWGWRREEFVNGNIFDHREVECEMFWGGKNNEILSMLNDIFDE